MNARDDRAELEALGVRLLPAREAEYGDAAIIEARIVARAPTVLVIALGVETRHSREVRGLIVTLSSSGVAIGSTQLRSDTIAPVADGLAKIARYVGGRT